MTARRPLVSVNGRVQELPAGDSVTGAGGTAIEQVSYDNRNNLRALSPADGDLALVRELGLFRWYSASTEADDDETCFATATGRWLMEAAHPEAMEAWLMPDEDHETRIGDAETDIVALQTNWPGKILHGTAASSITGISATSQASFTGTITGAAVGDRVIATPPSALAASISVFASVTAANTVTVYLNNPSAASASLVVETWKISVIKEA